MNSPHTLLCLAAGAGIAIAGAHVRQALETATTQTEPNMHNYDCPLTREARASVALDGETRVIPAKARTLDDLLDAIQAVETGGHVDPAHAWGDGGKSYGWLQISYACWADARGADGELRTPQHDRDWKSDASHLPDAQQIALDYWRRHCRAALDARDWQTLARVWNGGPRGAEKESTLAYWAKVRSAMENTR